jgi:hypothetical protein
VKIALNFHAYGNLFIHPFNFDSQENPILKKEFKEESEIYEEIWNSTGVLEGSIKGNGMKAIKYSANGEASDWMLGIHGIIALSPELGLTSS